MEQLSDAPTKPQMDLLKNYASQPAEEQHQIRTKSREFRSPLPSTSLMLLRISIYIHRKSDPYSELRQDFSIGVKP